MYGTRAWTRCKVDRWPVFRGMTGLKNNATLPLHEDWSLTADYTVSTVPTDEDLIVVGIGDSCYSVCKLRSLSRPLLFLLATCGFEDDRTLKCLPSVMHKVEPRQIFSKYQQYICIYVIYMCIYISSQANTTFYEVSIIKR